MSALSEFSGFLMLSTILRIGFAQSCENSDGVTSQTFCCLSLRGDAAEAERERVVIAICVWARESGCARRAECEKKCGQDERRDGISCYSIPCPNGKNGRDSVATIQISSRRVTTSQVEHSNMPKQTTDLDWTTTKGRTVFL